MPVPGSLWALLIRWKDGNQYKLKTHTQLHKYVNTADGVTQETHELPWKHITVLGVLTYCGVRESFSVFSLRVTVKYLKVGTTLSSKLE